MKDIAGKDFSYQADILMGHKYAVIVDHDPAAFLSPVLQGI